MSTWRDKGLYELMDPVGYTNMKGRQDTATAGNLSSESCTTMSRTPSWISQVSLMRQQ
jgi:hypothetical protein